MAGVTGVREDMWRVKLKIDGDDWGIWDQRSGGKVNANGEVYLPGGMAPQQSLGGVPATDALTLARNYQHQRDHNLIGKLTAKVGKGQCVAQAQPLDIDGNAFGKPIVWTGVLDSVDYPSVDSTSTKPAMLTVTIAVGATPTA